MSLLERLPRPRLGANTLLLLVGLYVALVLNRSLWRHVFDGLPADPGLPEAGILLTLFLALMFLLLLLQAVLSARVLLKPWLVLLLLAAAVCAYFMDSYGVVLDAAMMTNMFQTDPREAGELLGAAFFGHLLLYGALPALVVWRVEVVRGGTGGELARRALLVLAALAAFVASAGVNYKNVSLWIRPHRDIRLYANPTYPIFALVQYATAGAEGGGPRAPIGEDARRTPAASGKPRVVVLVVGEAARAENFSLLGYARDTNPELSKAEGLVAFSNVWSCATATAESVPCMFSRLGRANFSRRRALSEENVLDVLKHSGVDVRWRDNNSPCRGTCAGVALEDVRHLDVPGVCDGGNCLDDVLLQGLDARIKAAGGDRLIVLHMLGSHGPSYFRRYPPAFRRFLPECAQDAVQDCSREAIVNAYDNTLLYTDHVVAQALALLRQHRAQVEPTLLYVSDHGESLGENGLYLHTLPFMLAPDVQKHVAMLLWSPGLDLQCLQGLRDQAASHDNLFHTVLGLFGVETREYKPELDLFRGCRRAAVS